MTEISWKLLIFASKAFISCIFPKNNKFSWFSWKIHVCNMLLIKKFFPWAWKSPENTHCLPRKKVYFMFPCDLCSFFQWKKLFWTDFHIFPSEPSYIYTTISIKKLFIKWCNSTEKQSCSLFVIGKSAALCTAHKPPEKLSIFSQPSASNWPKNNITFS